MQLSSALYCTSLSQDSYVQQASGTGLVVSITLLAMSVAEGCCMYCCQTKLVCRAKLHCTRAPARVMHLPSFWLTFASSMSSLFVAAPKLEKQQHVAACKVRSKLGVLKA